MVCGSTKGIGYACAEALAALGADLVLVARDEAALKDRCETLKNKFGVQTTFIQVDFSDPETLKNRVQAFCARNDIQILVNNTGGPPAGMISEAKEQEFMQTFQAHLIGNHILTMAVLPGMKKSGYGRIINIISTSVKQPLPNLGVSNTIRAAVANWSKTMANELGAFGITVNNVLPGATGTERLTAIINNKAAKTNASKEKVEEEMLQEIPMKRFGKPEEIANAVAFLASPAASYINGINVPVDGGRTASL